METSVVEHDLPSTEKEDAKSPQKREKDRKRPDSSDAKHEETGTSESASNHLALYNQENGKQVQDYGEDGENHQNLTPMRRSRGVPSIGAFAVQCAKCFKWRLIPTKEKYEEIRERILQNPFVCVQAHDWNPEITCDSPEDISQDGSRLWAIDKPSIARPPTGWERVIRIRAEGGTRFADVHYTSPSAKKLRSMVEIEKYLNENPEYAKQGVSISQFSFQIPRPLQVDYVKRRPLPPGTPAPSGLTRATDSEEVNPISWAAPSTSREAQAAEPAHSPGSQEQADDAAKSKRNKA